MLVIYGNIVPAIPTEKKTTVWRCCKRSVSLTCPASVIQDGNTFTKGLKNHVHPAYAEPGIHTATKIKVLAKKEAKDNVFSRSCPSIAERAMSSVGSIDEPIHSRPPLAALIRSVQRVRQALRPSDPTDVSSAIEEDFIESSAPGFYQKRVKVGERRHHIFCSERQLQLLAKAKTWYMDATFRVINKPYSQLFSIHAFVKAGDTTRQLPLVFCVMSGKSQEDYYKTMASTTSSAFSDEEEEQPVYEFPKTLKDFGFKFNEKGELRNIETDKPFDFMARKINKPQTEEEKLLNLNERRDHQRYNQKRYEALGEIITDYVYDLLEKETKLKKVYIPDDAEEDEPKSFVFMSEDALTNPKLLLIIHGSGVVRAGQWSRRLIINNNLDKGTQLPYIKKGLELGFGIIVFNTNLNKVKINGKEHLVRLNETPEDHGMYVWKYIVQNAKATNIGIVAHSYGGIVTLEMASLFEDDFLNRVFGIGFTDSVHSYKHQLGVEDVAIVDFLRERAMNYVSSDKALGTPVVSFESHDCPAVSAGTDQHELTSWSCFDLLFTFLQEKYKVYATKVDQSGGGDDKPGSSKSTSTESDQQQASGDTQQTESTTKIKSEL